MLKKLLIGILVAVIAVGAGTSVFTVLASKEPTALPVVGNAEPASEAAAVAAGELAATTLVSQEPAGVAVPSDVASLLYMYEEEKMARDVYNALYAIWGQNPFSNIAVSEQAHMDAIAVLLQQTGTPIPNTAAGVFNDAAIQNLYNSLTAKGSTSLAEALKVGAMIEEVDILDLQTRLAQTTNTEIQLVYNNLMKASYSHLRNYVNVLQRQTREVYQPQVLSADLYASILAGSNGQGMSGGGTRTILNGTGSTRGRGQRGGQ